MGPRRSPLLCCAALLAALAGCSSNDGRLGVSGKVTLESQPLKDGVITFVPLDGQDTRSGAPVVNGEYTVPPENGLKPGKYLVQITAGDGKTPASEDQVAAPGETNIVSFDLVPPEWNTNSKQQVDVTPDGENKFDFDIPKANVPKRRR